MIYIISALVFFSGISGLACEVIWAKHFALIFGNSAYANAAILALFMGGLALGNAFFGKFADKVKNKILLYAPKLEFMAPYALYYNVPNGNFIYSIDERFIPRPKAERHLLISDYIFFRQPDKENIANIERYFKKNHIFNVVRQPKK